MLPNGETEYSQKIKGIIVKGIKTPPGNFNNKLQTGIYCLSALIWVDYYNLNMANFSYYTSEIRFRDRCYLILIWEIYNEWLWLYGFNTES